jgi:transposase
VGLYVKRAHRAGLVTWKDVEGLDDIELDRRLFPPPERQEAERPLPQWGTVHTEMQQPGVTRYLLWQEYKEREPGGVEYSRFCGLYRDFVGRLDLSMRQVHLAGEKMFVDYCGPTVTIRDPGTGESRTAQIFVSVLGASNFTFAEATWTQGLEDWVGSHERAWKYYGGVTQEVVQDNLKSGITKPCRYEPSVNPTYQDLATHYGVAVMPARVRKPKDKAKVETAVLVVERWILASLRHRVFFSLHELNRAIQELLERLNDRPFRKLEGTRRSRFEVLDQPALRPLPSQRFEFATWAKARVNRDYHVAVEGHHYSVPYSLVGQELDVRITEHGIECLDRSRRVACHQRSYEVGGMTTLPEHMPAAHRGYAERSPEQLLAWASTVGDATVEMVHRMLDDGRHWRQGFQAAEGLRSLNKRYGGQRLDAACLRALHIQSVSFTSVKSILSNGLDGLPLPDPEPSKPPQPALEPEHVRGAEYYLTPDAAPRGLEEGSSC